MRRRRWLLLLLALLVAGGALVAVQVARLGPAVVQFLERHVPGQLVVESWGVRFRPSVAVVAYGITLLNPSAVSATPLLRAGRLEVGLDGVRLLAGRLRITRLRLYAPVFTLEALGGRWNLESPRPARTQPRRDGTRQPSRGMPQPFTAPAVNPET